MRIENIYIQKKIYVYMKFITKKSAAGYKNPPPTQERCVCVCCVISILRTLVRPCP